MNKRVSKKIAGAKTKQLIPITAEETKIGVRLPLDLLLIKDTDELELAQNAKWAVEHEGDIYFCDTDDDLQDLILDFEKFVYYQIDEIEIDRIQAIIDLLSIAEKEQMLSHILDRIVR